MQDFKLRRNPPGKVVPNEDDFQPKTGEPCRDGRSSYVARMRKRAGHVARCTLQSPKGDLQRNATLQAPLH